MQCRRSRDDDNHGEDTRQLRGIVRADLRKNRRTNLREGVRQRQQVKTLSRIPAGKVALLLLVEAAVARRRVLAASQQHQVAKVVEPLRMLQLVKGRPKLARELGQDVFDG
jgi:hypothetical protein